MIMPIIPDAFTMDYDREADVLYVTKGKPAYTDYVEYTDDIILHFDPQTKELVGFTIIDFLKYFLESGGQAFQLPFQVNFGVNRDELLLAA